MYERIATNAMLVRWDVRNQGMSQRGGYDGIATITTKATMTRTSEIAIYERAGFPHARHPVA